mgnify:CR=1 FL=1
MSQAIADLRHEHDALLAALQILARMPAQADAADLAAYVDFLREMVQAMAQACTPSLQAADFAAAATAYAEHLRAHIAKENDVLFPMAERLLDDPVLASLQQRFAEHEQKVMGAGHHQQLHARLQQWRTTYLG